MANDPSKAGQTAAAPLLFGANLQIAVFPVHTRFESIQWFVADLSNVDEFDMALVVGQFASKADAIGRAVQVSA